MIRKLFQFFFQITKEFLFDIAFGNNIWITQPHGTGIQNGIVFEKRNYFLWNFPELFITFTLNFNRSPESDYLSPEFLCTNLFELKRTDLIFHRTKNQS